MAARNQDFVVKNGLQVTSNLVVGAYTGTATPQIANGAIISGNVGIGTSTVPQGSRLDVAGGNITINTVGYGLVFPDGSFQYEAAQSYGPQYTLQFAGINNTFSGDGSNLYWDAGGARLNTSNLTINSNTATTAPGSGALIVTGGTSIGGNLYVAGAINITGNINVANVSGIQDLTVNSLVSNTFVRAGSLLSGQSILSSSSVTAASYVKANQIIANVNVGIGTATVQYPLDIYGNIHIGNTASTSSGILFPDGTFQNTAAFYTPSYGPPGTIQFAGNDNTFSGDASNFAWYAGNTTLQVNGGLVSLNNATANLIDFGINGVDYPSYGPGSAGTKINLYNDGVDIPYSLGIDPTPAMSFTIPSGAFYNYYGGGCVIAQLDSVGNWNNTGTAQISGCVTISGGTITLNNYFGNYIDFGINGYAPPSFSTRSVGSKLVLSDQIDVSHTDFAIGMDNAVLWTGVPQNNSTYSFAWYGGITPVMTLDGTGVLTVANSISTPSFSVTGNISAGNVNVIHSQSIGNNLVIGGNLTVAGNFQFGNVGVAQDITVNSLTSNTFVQAAGVGRFGRIVANANAAIGTITVTGSNVLSVLGTANYMGNIYITNTATTSGITFSDGTYQATAAANTPSFGAPGTIQFAGSSNLFSGNSSALFWDDSKVRLGIGTNLPAQPLTVSGNLLLTYGNVHQIYGRVGIGSSNIKIGDNLLVYGGNINVATFGTGIYFPDGSFQKTSAGTSAAGPDKSVQFNDAGAFAGQNNFAFDKINARLGIGTSMLNNSLGVYGGSPALFNTTNGADQQIIVGNAASDGAVVGFNSGATTAYGYLQYAGSVLTNIAFTKVGTGIGGITVPVNTLDIGGGIAIGSAYAGVQTAPSDGLIAVGSVGIGTFAPGSALDVATNASIRGRFSVAGEADIGGLVVNTSIAVSSLNISGLLQAGSMISNTTIQVDGAAYVNSLISNTTIQSIGIATLNEIVANTNTTTNTLNARGLATVNDFISNTNVTSDTVNTKTLARVAALISNNNISGATINVSGLAQLNSLVSNTTIQSIGTATVNALISNNNVFGATLQSSGQALVNSLVSNNNITTATFNSTGAAQVNSLISNNNITTATFNATGAAEVNSLIANTTIQGMGTATVNALYSNTFIQAAGNLTVGGVNSNGTIQAAGTATVNALIANNIFGATIVSNGTAQFGNVISNGYTTTANLNVTGNAQIANLAVNSSISTGTITSSGAAIFASMNSNGAIQVGGTATVNNLISNTNVFGATLQSSGQALVGSLSSNTTIQSAGAGVFNGLTSNTTVSITSGGLQAFGNSKITGNLQVTGNLTLGGNSTTITVQSLSITNPTVQLGIGTGGTPLVVDDGFDRGLFMDYYKDPPFNGELAGFNHAFLGWQDSTDRLIFLTNVAPGILNVTDQNADSYPGVIYGGAVFGNIWLSNAQSISTNTTSGGVVTIGGIGVGGNINVGGQVSNFSGNVNISGSNTATSATTGALTVAAGAGILGNLYVGGNLVANNGAQFSYVVASNAITAASIFSNGIIQTASALVAASIDSNGTITGSNFFSNGAVQASGNVTAGGLNANGTIVGSQIWSNSTIQAAGNITVGGVNSNGSIVASQITSNSTIQAAGTATVNALIANNNVFGATLNTSGLAQLNSLIANNNITTSTLNSTGAAEVNSLIANTTVQAIGTATVNALIANNNVYGATLNTSGLAQLNSIVSNNNTTTSTLNTTGQAQVNSLIANANIQGANLNITGTAFAGNVYSNGFIQAAGTVTVNALIGNNNVYGGTLQTSGLATVNALVSNTYIQAANLNITSAVIASSITSNTYIQAGTYALVNSLTSNVYGLFGQNVTINSTNASTASNNGALVVLGGAGIGGNVNAAGQQNNFTGNLLVNGANVSISPTTGALIVTNGAGIGGNLYVAGNVVVTSNISSQGQQNTFGGNLLVNGTNASTTSSTGALVVTNGVGIGGNLNVGGSRSLFINSVGIGTSSTGVNSNVFAVYGTETLYGNLVLQNTAGQAGIYFADGSYLITAGGGGSYSNANVTSYLSGPVQIGNLTINNTTVSTSTTTGALLMGGGAGIQGNINIGGQQNNFSGNMIVAGANASTSSSTGALVITNGAGIGGNLNVGGNLTVSNAAQFSFVVASNSLVASSVISNSLITAAGTATVNAVVSNVYGAFGQNVTVLSSNTSISTATGALVITGGVGIGGNLNVGGTYNLFANNVGIGTSTIVGLGSNVFAVYGTENLYGNLVIQKGVGSTAGIYFADGSYLVTAGGGGSYSNVNVASYLSGNVSIGNLTITNATASTSSTSGALQMFGGAGIGGNLNVGSATTSTFAGNVGIGTASSLGATSNVMTVYGATNQYGNIVLRGTGTSSNVGIYFPDGTFQYTASMGGGGSTPGGSNTNIQYNFNGALAGSGGLVFFGNTNSMGIGTSAPAYNLDVWGNIHIGNSATGGSNGIVFADGTIQTSAPNAAVQTFTFTATAGQNTFSVYPYNPGPQGVNLTQVFVNGVYQRTSTYAWTGTNIVLTVGAVQYARVEIRITVPATSLTNVGSKIAGSNVFNVQTAGVTVWNTGFVYTVGYLDVYLNGIKLTLGQDYTAGTGTSVTFAASPPVNSIVQMTGWNTNGVQQIQGNNVFNVQTSGVTVWNTGFTYTVGYLDVYVNGVKLASGYDYTATTGTSVQFTNAPTKNSLVTFEGWTQGSTLGQLATQRKALYVASAGQTVFASQGPYVPPYVDVYVNGIKLILNTDYTATDGATVVMASGLLAGSNVEVISSMTFAIGDVVRRTGDIFTGNVGIGTSAASSAFVVVGASQFYGNVNVFGNINTTGGRITTTDGLTIGGNIAVTGTATIGSNLSIGGTLFFPDGSTQNTSSQNQLQVLNDISTAFDGQTTTFNLYIGTSNINIATPQQLLVSVGGAVLAPFITNPDYIDLSEVTLFTRGYKLNNGHTIVFANAPRWQQDFSGRVLSNTAPVNNTVTYPFKPLNIALADG